MIGYWYSDPHHSDLTSVLNCANNTSVLSPAYQIKHWINATKVQR